MAHTLDIASDDSRRAEFHAKCHEIFLCQRQERDASNFILQQNVQGSLAQLIGKLSLKVLNELLRAPPSDVGDGRQLCDNDRASS